MHNVSAHARAYRVSRQQIYRLMQDGVLRRAFNDPSTLFIALLERTASPLRSRLTDPAERERITEELLQLNSKY